MEMVFGLNFVRYYQFVTTVILRCPVELCQSPQSTISVAIDLKTSIRPHSLGSGTFGFKLTS